MQGIRLTSNAVVSCETGLYYVPKFLVSKSGKVNFIARYIVKKLSDNKIKNRKLTSLSISLMVGLRCNLACPYCYQRNTEESALKKPNINLPDNFPNNILNFCKKKAKEQDVKYSTVTLLGGEPFLYTEQSLKFLEGLNKELEVKYLSLVTNGTLITEDKLDAFMQYKLRSLQFTFDGGRDYHDNTRMFPTGKGSYDVTLESLRLSLSKNLDITVRINLVADNFSSIPSLLDDLAEINSEHQFGIYFALINDTNFYKNDSPTDFWYKYREMVNYALSLGFSVALQPHNGSCPTCGDYKNPQGIVVTGDGSLYSCWESAGQEGQEVGDCKNGYYLNRKSRWSRCGDSTADNVKHRLVLDTIKIIDDFNKNKQA